MLKYKNVKKLELNYIFLSDIFSFITAWGSGAGEVIYQKLWEVFPSWGHNFDERFVSGSGSDRTACMSDA